MYKIDLRLKTLFPAIMGATDEATDIEFRVISENGMSPNSNEKFIYAQNVDVILDKLLKEYKE